MRRLRRVNLAEKVMKASSASPPALSCFSSSSSSSSSSFPSSFGLVLHHFELEANVKWVKTGRRRMEGWARKVLKMPRCQQEARLSSKPGRNVVVKIVAINGTLLLYPSYPSPQ